MLYFVHFLLGTPIYGDWGFAAGELFGALYDCITGNKPGAPSDYDYLPMKEFKDNKYTGASDYFFKVKIAEKIDANIRVYSTTEI